MCPDTGKAGFDRICDGDCEASRFHCARKALQEGLVIVDKKKCRIAANGRNIVLIRGFHQGFLLIFYYYSLLMVRNEEKVKDY
jgi:hypothetical protein